ncbi:hypothetical protein V865_005448 [Kwoniella europaea PYCC6329]|uniref:F-box domain-containing protein n=1 Tax=Kwoniella europaea PYCC6329 TaxID=1423913 RepID=A0AAX4KP52_9TREE
MTTETRSLVDDRTAFQRLLPVHHLILSHLSRLAPTTYLLLSRYHHDQLVRSLYSSITPDLSTLHGLTYPSPRNQRTLNALSQTITLIVSPQSSWALLRATKGIHPFSKAHKELFRNVQNIHLTWKALYARISGTPPPVNGLQIENNLWFHVKNPIKHLIIDIESLGSDSALFNSFLSTQFYWEIQVMMKSFKPTSTTWRYLIHKEDINSWGLDTYIEVPARIWCDGMDGLRKVTTVFFPKRPTLNNPGHCDGSSDYRIKVTQIVDQLVELVNEKMKKRALGNEIIQAGDRGGNSSIRKFEDLPRWTLEVEGADGRVVESRVLMRLDHGRYDFVPS